MAAQLDLHRLSLARASATPRPAGRCRASRRSAACSACRSSRCRSAGMLWLLVRGAAQAAIASALIVAAAGRRRGAAPRRLDRSRPASRSRVALLQGNVAQEHEVPARALRAHPRDLRAARRGHRRAADRAARDRAAALPTTASSRAYLARLEAAARRNGGDLLLGVPYRDGRAASTTTACVSLGTVAAPGLPQAHLVPFGEFMPPGFGWMLRPAVDPAVGLRARRADQPPLAVAGQRVAVNICYEDAFGDEIARGAAARPRCWSTCPTSPGSATRSRRRSTCRSRGCARSRPGACTSPRPTPASPPRSTATARVLARLPQFTEGRLEVAAQGYAGATPYVRCGDWPVARCSRSRCSRRARSSRGAGCSR